MCSEWFDTLLPPTQSVYQSCAAPSSLTKAFVKGKNKKSPSRSFSPLLWQPDETGISEALRSTRGPSVTRKDKNAQLVPLCHEVQLSIPH